MHIFENITDTKEHILELKNKGMSIGFVPTMGALHPGHISLIRQAHKENDIVAASIFVNPIQFNNQEDLKKYPRTPEKDFYMLESAGCDIVFYPTAVEMYPEKVNVVYDFGILDKVMEGKFRPGHFNGVAIVVKKLFDITLPDKAYFGEKDFQQLAIIKALVKKENIPVAIVPCPTIRESDGLAMSSRNERLNEEERAIAPVIYNTLLEIREKIKKEPIPEILSWATEKINNQPGMTVEYIEIVNSDTLLPVRVFDTNIPTRACLAAFLGQVRLIDNLGLDMN